MEIAPLISVIVPVYKAEKHLKRCVRSIQEQSYSNIEIILVDDGSPDNCPAVCDQFAAEDSRIKVIHKENGGVSSARNAGLQVGKGKYIAFVDSDDYLEPGLYQEVAKYIDKWSPDLLDFGINHLTPDYRLHRTEVHAHPKNRLLGKSYIREQIIPQLIHVEDKTDFYIGTWIWNKIYKASILKEHNLEFDEKIKIWEDGIFVVEYLYYAASFVSLTGEFYNYINISNSLSTRHDPDIFLSIATIYARYQSLFQNDYDFGSSCSKKYQFDLVYGTIKRELNGEITHGWDRKTVNKTIRSGLLLEFTRNALYGYCPKNPLFLLLRVTLRLHIHQLVILECRLMRWLYNTML